MAADLVVVAVAPVGVASTMTKYPECLLLLYRLLLLALLVMVDASTLEVELVDHILVVVGSNHPTPVLKLELVEVLQCLSW